MKLSQEYKNTVIDELIARRDNFGGTDAQYAKIYGLTGAVYSRLNKGEREKLVSDSQILQIGRELGINNRQSSWKVVRTKVYDNIEGGIKTCQDKGVSMILVDDCGIGKTFCAKAVVKNLKNGFYVDCSQAKSKQQFIKLLAKTLGVDNKGKYYDILENVKYYINQLENPIIVLDEFGDLEYSTFVEYKGIWNATENHCGWYMMGADGLRSKIEKGMNAKKVGFAEIFSRLSDNFISLTPIDTDHKKAFRYELLNQVAQANHTGTKPVEELVAKCMSKDATLRHLDTLIKISA
jgi:hypothetical protein